MEPTEAQINALGRELERRKGFRQLMDEITFQDERDESEIPEDEEWTPEQRAILEALVRSVLGAGQSEREALQQIAEGDYCSGARNIARAALASQGEQ